MHRNVLEHEPPEALFVPDNDPLRFYKAIARHARHTLLPGGQLFFECNPEWLDATADMLHDEGFHDIETRDDPFGKPRFITSVFGKWSKIANQIDEKKRDLVDYIHTIANQIDEKK